jgi:hypothetical protein
MTIKLLFLAANPTDTDRLRLDEESRDQFELKTHWAVRADDLQELLMRYQPDIVHFSGHGNPVAQSDPRLRLQSRHQLFPQVLQLVHQYVASRVNFRGVDPQMLGQELKKIL